MKHLKGFNEELKSSTYKSAASKLKVLGHNRRSGVVGNWADLVQSREENVAIEEARVGYAKNGIFEMVICTSKYDSEKKHQYILQ